MCQTVSKFWFEFFNELFPLVSETGFKECQLFQKFCLFYSQNLLIGIEDHWKS
jgi:hypothetical protein